MILKLLFAASLLATSLSTFAADNNTQIATFAGGCFWCMEPPFDKLDGVLATTSGYTGGHQANPTYQQVSAGSTGHTEAIQIEFDSTKISYERTTRVCSGKISTRPRPIASSATRATSIGPVFFTTMNRQKNAAEKSLAALQQNKPFTEAIVTEITSASTFYPAEEYHQDYYQKNPLRYKYYRFACGRDQRLEQLWGKADDH